MAAHLVQFVIAEKKVQQIRKSEQEQQRFITGN